MTTPCAGCQFLQYVARGTIPRTLCTRYRKPALAKCLDYQEKRETLSESFDRLLYEAMSGKKAAP